MNLHEYQAKELLRRFNVPTLKGYAAFTPRAAQKAAANLGNKVCVVKAQIHAGGRGKAGGVKVVKNADEALKAAEGLLGKKLVTPQTGPAGKVVQKLYVEAGAEIAREFYLSLIVDRERAGIALIASAEGGVEIEEVAAKTPEKVATVLVRPEVGVKDFHVREISRVFSLSKDEHLKLLPLIQALYAAFRGYDCSLLEINPLILTKSGDFFCLDAKMAVDDNALFRQRAAAELLDYDEIDAREIHAGEIGISYIALSGNIGCMVNGAGLAMATMDVIKSAGGEPANFLDVGGGATKEMVAEAFKIILTDSAVKGILVNIFGGIMRCDVLAEGIVAAAKELDVKVPLVVRLEGTNVELGREILEKSGLRLTAAADMADAAAKIVAAVR